MRNKWFFNQIRETTNDGNYRLNSPFLIPALAYQEVATGNKIDLFSCDRSLLKTAYFI